MEAVVASASGWIDEAVQTGGYYALAGLILIENLFPPIPSEVILPLAGYYVERGDMMFIPAVLAATIGSVLGALILYYGSAKGGRPLVERHAHRVHMSMADVDRAQAWFDRYGPWVVLFGRMVPGVRSLVSIPAGLAHMSVVRFTLLTTLGSLVWNTLLIGAGWALGSEWEAVGDIIGPASKPIIGAVLVILLGLLFVRNCRRRAAERVEHLIDEHIDDHGDHGDHGR